MANIADLVKTPNLIKSSKIWGLPYGKDDKATSDTFLRSIVQYILASPYAGIMTVIPAEVKLFFRQTPQHPALGEGIARSTIGRVHCWPLPTIEIGEQYKHIKPPHVPVYEEKIKNQFKLQSSVAIETQQWLENYIDKNQRDKLISFIVMCIRSAINVTIVEMFTLFWLTIFDKYSFDISGMYTFSVKATETNEHKAQGLYKKYQEQMDEYYKTIQKETEHIKNITFYDPEYFLNWSNKEDNKVTVTEVKKPEGINDHKTWIEKLYLTADKKIPNTREMSLMGMLKEIRRDIYEISHRDPSHKNAIGWDPSKTNDANVDLHLLRCDKNLLVVVLSDWDYVDLDGQTISIPALSGSRTDTLSAAAAGVQAIIPLRGIPPGCYFVGDNALLNFIIVLDHEGDIFHWREEERQYYLNYFLIMGSFKRICGRVKMPSGNFNAGGNFYNQYAFLIK